ncbi:response regulator [Mastigocoleus sp. MO_188.B34]|uniref:ATP-binding response regulator n=1 Tax=Mastigocoleus sp. MO_188.B34 TaxID=3036635 RepID=UPI0026068AC5|nr:response regulator [Mastigocoleus sp. MO_188.B34]MDJ0695321.1 response regulator [Mastigocoleus sp. MO_188.B34]
MNGKLQQLHHSKILIVDDSIEEMQMLSATLSQYGYTVRGASAGSMALKAAHALPPDLILLDIRMPDLDGYEVCQKLKSDRVTCDIPIIFLSAIQNVDDKIKAFKLGGADYITKPFQVEEVLARIENQLIIRRLSQQLKEQNHKLKIEIEERRKAENIAFRAYQTKNEFLARMSHELQTPLNSILGFTQIMSRDTDLKLEHQEYLKIINNSGEYLLQLINEVLEISKAEAGINTIEEKEFDFYYLLDSLEEIFKIKAVKNKNKLSFIVAADVPQYIKTDDKKLRICLLNLIDNALKFTKNGSVNLRVWQENRSLKKDDAQYLYFEVEDSGYGIAEEEIIKLFDAFVQTESGKKSTQGTGLGLNITRKFVEMLGGKIQVASILGKGSLFKFNVKFTASERSQVDTLEIPQVIALKPGKQVYKILVVDDTKESRLWLLKLLESVGFEVRSAENGKDAITTWENWHPHLIWMDTRMPVINGYEATQQIRFKEVERQTDMKIVTQKTIIIALINSINLNNKQEILAAGYDDFVPKPLTEVQVFDRIAKFLDVSYIYKKIPIISNKDLIDNKYLSKARFNIEALEELAMMPQGWLKNLYYASSVVDEDLVNSLIAEISNDKNHLKSTLNYLMKNFQLDRIIEFTKKALGNEKIN